MSEPTNDLLGAVAQGVNNQALSEIRPMASSTRCSARVVNPLRACLEMLSVSWLNIEIFKINCVRIPR